MNAIQNTIKTSEKVSPVSCYCKLSDLVPYLRELSQSKLTVRTNPENPGISAPSQIMNSGFAVLMYVNR